jgi:hypothetical protein
MKLTGRYGAVDAAAIRDSLPRSLLDILVKEIALVFDTPMLDKVVPTIETLDKGELGRYDFVFIFEPPSIHQRIISQHGLLSVANGVEKNQDDIFSKLNIDVKKIIMMADA